MYLTRVARKRKAVIAGRWRRVLRGFGEPSQFRGAICSFAFLRWNVRHSVVHFARRARFCLHRAGCSPTPYAYNVHRATTRNRNEEMQNLLRLRPRSDYLSMKRANAHLKIGSGFRQQSDSVFLSHACCVIYVYNLLLQLSGVKTICKRWKTNLISFASLWIKTRLRYK